MYILNMLWSDLQTYRVPGHFEPDNLQCRLYSADRLVLVTSTGHALSGRDSMTFEDCTNLPHVGLRDSTLLEYITERANLLNCKPSMRVLMSSYETMCAMIAGGVGVGILLESCAERYIRAGMPLTIVKLADMNGLNVSATSSNETATRCRCTRALSWTRSSPFRQKAQRGWSACLSNRPCGYP
jgi:DNA-binding transcriptional LysR family regulator